MTVGGLPAAYMHAHQHAPQSSVVIVHCSIAHARGMHIVI
jgi:hypothetical protein